MARPTLADVARESGVSSGAVSLILRDQGRFSDETRERVLQAARQVDYRPHPFLSQPKTGKFKASKTTSAVPIALLWKYHDPIVEATDAFAERLGYQLNKIEFTEEMNAVHFGNTLYARGYSGIILGQLYSKNALPDLGWSRFATVCVGRPFFPVPFDVVREELTESFIQLFRTCRGRGYRRIGIDVMIHRSWSDAHPDDRARHAAALFCLESVPKEDRVPLHLGHPLDSESFLKWVEQSQPEVVLGCMSSRRGEMERHGIRIPEDIAFATTDNRDSTGETTGWFFDKDQDFLKAVQVMDHLIRHNLFGASSKPSHLLTQPTWIEGNSLPFSKGADT